MIAHHKKYQIAPMLNKMLNHPSLCYPNEIGDICMPLKHLNISYFSHVNIDSSKRFSAICNNPNFCDYYFSNRHYNADIHMAEQTNLGNLILWDALAFDNKSAVLADEAKAFGVKHVFTIVEKNQSGSDFFHFATHLDSTVINQIYMANFDLLKLFTSHFKEKINLSKALKVGHDIKFDLELESNEFSLKTDDSFSSFEFDRSEFIKNLISDIRTPLHPIKKFSQIDNLALIHKDTCQPVSLAPQQIRCLLLLASGLSAKQIANTLKISYRTVEHHIEKIKRNLGCHNIKELLGIYSYQLNRVVNDKIK